MNNLRNLTKTNFIRGLQCPKLLWIAANDYNKISSNIDSVTQYRFDQGHQVGELAHSLYPDGIALGTADIGDNLKETQSSLALRRPLFEAGFSCQRLYCRVDILNPAGEGEWDIIEVKSSNNVHDEHLDDVAFQRLCCLKAGLRIRNCYVMHLNGKYVKQGDIDPSKFFVLKDVTESLDVISADLNERIQGMLSVISSKDCPETGIGLHCRSPYDCVLRDECWSDMPEHHVFTLYHDNELGEHLLQQGINHIAGIPEYITLNAKHQIQKKCVISGKPHIDSAAIGSFLDKLQYPLYFMDFETFETAIPIYDSSRPHQAIPFQFSMHVLREPNVEPEHYSFLAEGKSDPRPGFLAELNNVSGSAGSVLAYYSPFEEGRLKELAVDFPENGGWIEKLIKRIIDLYAPFKDFSFYHPDQHGSASLKKVMPALTNLSYENLEIGEGATASLKYLEASFGNITEEERKKIRADLLTYCGQDTGGMVEIIKQLVAVSQCCIGQALS